VPSRVLRDNVFLFAAVALPLLVVGLFLVASAVPRWTVEPPGYDLVIRADGGYQPDQAQVLVGFRVREGRVVAEVQPAAPNTYPQRPSLYLFDHVTADVRELPLDLPLRLAEGETLRVVPIEALAKREVLDGPNAPDGYAFDLRYRRGPGVVGELFGMGRYDAGAAVVKGGRVVPLMIPPPQRYSIQSIGWLAPEVAR
jgi:hypothetical protein